MRVSLRLRFFFWLLMLLLIFILVQSVLYSAVELATIERHPELTLTEQLLEVAAGVGLNIILLPFIAWVAWRISSRMLAPIHALALAAEDISDGKLDRRVDTADMGDDDMRSLARAINQAFDRYHAAIEKLERFASDASHQLRTPLAAIRATAEVALAREREASEYRDVLGSVLEDVARLSRLIDHLLAMARLDRRAQNKHLIEFDLGELLEELSDMYRPACEQMGIELVCSNPAAGSLRGNRALIIEALRNLLDNSLRYAGEGGRIHMLAERDRGCVQIAVKDSGPGIPEDQAESVFKRFNRGGAHDDQGWGLGLPMALAIIRFHNGDVRLSREPGWGAVFVVTIPVQHQA